MLLSLPEIENAARSLVCEEPAAAYELSEKRDLLTPGTIIEGCYRVEESVEPCENNRFCTVTRVRGGGVCPSCGQERGETGSRSCQNCGARLKGRLFQMEVLPEPLDPEFIQKLLEISHPDIAQIYEILSFGCEIYVISEHLRGVPVDCVRGGLTGRQIQTIGICLTHTVGFLHDHGIYHMDLQPYNVKLVDGHPRLRSLSASRLENHAGGHGVDRYARTDYGELLETLEKVTAECGYQHEGNTLVRLLVALEEMIGRDDLSLLDIQQALGTL
jgi:serine/threonine protein kinase